MKRCSSEPPGVGATMWKIRIGDVTRYAAVLAAGLAMSAAASADVRMEGSWIGSVSDAGKQQRLVFTVDRDTYFRRRAFMDSPDDGWMRIPATAIADEAGTMKLEFRTIGASLEVAPQYGGKRLDGTFVWQGNPHKISLSRVAHPPAASAASYRRKQVDSSGLFAQEPIEDRPASATIEAAMRGAERMPFLNSVVVVKDGEVVLERYFHGTDARTLFNVKSVSKSVMSALFGIARAQGRIDLDQRLCALLDEAHRRMASPAHCRLRMRDLLTMQTGLDYIEGRYPPGGDPVFDSDDWLAAALRLGQLEPPGTHYSYATPVTHLLAAAMTHALGEDLLEYANRELFTPIGIKGVEWTQSPEGIRFGGSEVFMSARDMALFGQLYVRRGMVSDVQLIPEEWISSSTRNQLATANRRIEYGYLWKPNRWNSSKAAYRAAGVGGQYIVNIPETRVTIAITANPRYMSGVEANADAILAWIESELLPSLPTWAAESKSGLSVH